MTLKIALRCRFYLPLVMLLAGLVNVLLGASAALSNSPAWSVLIYFGTAGYAFWVMKDTYRRWDVIVRAEQQRLKKLEGMCQGFISKDPP